jgi:polysaccharide export outer membrane protein
MRFFICTWLVFSILLIFSSCSYKQDQILFEHKNAVIDTSAQNNGDGIANYKIQPQDILQIRNLQNIKYIVDVPTTDNGATSGGGSTSSEGESFQVEEDGNVALPVIGHVPVVGLTRIEATNKIEGLYRAALLKDPIIDLKITNLKVTVLGEIKTQGNFPLIKDRTSLVEIIGEAGGLTDRANEKNIKIIRGNKNNPEIMQVDLSNVSSLTDPATILHNGDIIYIAENKRAIRSDKLQNFTTIVQPALLIFNTALIIFTLVHR